MFVLRLLEMGVLCELNFSTRSGKSGVMANETELIDAQDSYLDHGHGSFLLTDTEH